MMTRNATSRRRLGDLPAPRSAPGGGRGAAAPPPDHRQRVSPDVLSRHDGTNECRRRERSPSLLTIGGGESPHRRQRQQQRREEEEADGLVGPPPPKRAAAAAATTNATNATSIVNPVKEEVQELLEKKLFGSNHDGTDEDLVIIGALKTLIGYFDNAGPNDGKDEHRTWAVDRHACLLVLILLRQRLDDKQQPSAAKGASSGGAVPPNSGSANVLVVLRALNFLEKWNEHSEQCRDDFSTFDGVGTVVRVLHDYSNVALAVRGAIAVLLAYAGAKFAVSPTGRRVPIQESRASRRRELVEAGAIVPAYRYLVTLSSPCQSPHGWGSAFLLLELLCDDIAAPDDVRTLTDEGAVVFFAKEWNQMRQNQVQQPASSLEQRAHLAADLASCRKWIDKLTHSELHSRHDGDDRGGDVECRWRERSSSPPIAGDGQPATKRAAAPSSSVDPVKKEVQELLEKKLLGMGSDGKDYDEIAKSSAFLALMRYFDKSRSDYKDVDEHRRWVMQLQGCYLVLIVLRQQLDKEENPTGPSALAITFRRQRNFKVVIRALEFLEMWNAHSEQCRNDMSKFGGVGTVVRALQVYPDAVIARRAAISVLLTYAGARVALGPTGRVPIVVNRSASGGGPEGQRCRELVEAGAIIPVYRALMRCGSPCQSHQGKGIAFLLLELLCDDATPDDVLALNDEGAVVLFANGWNQLRQKQSEEARSSPLQQTDLSADLASCRKWINKLTS